MALPLPTHSHTENVMDQQFIKASALLIERFCTQEQRMPVILVIGYNSALVAFLSQYSNERIIVCDPNIPESVTSSAQISILRHHSLRIPSSLKVDAVILNVFNSATINRWAPVYIMRDLFRRGIIRSSYVLPSKATMSIRLYHHPAMNMTPASKITWESGCLTNTDLLTSVGERIDVLYEQYDKPAQSWPSAVTFGALSEKPLIAVLEWSLQFAPGMISSYLAKRQGYDEDAAKRLLNGSLYFTWPASWNTMRFDNSPKSAGGIKLTESKTDTNADQNLAVSKMDAAIERWYGTIVVGDSF